MSDLGSAEVTATLNWRPGFNRRPEDFASEPI